ncbi:glycine-rich RNA-binding protein blt801-like [Salvia miltiorrhiza]|uniref:glycine-rich RNA-binding protein blt801-like n=1 Tax=Salvia miltiorrhiza TaxID=226208 RepID=UPI0025ABF45B|nr:glycine-rich RNA-binding protein blt801-like [Salvia miltiorrhiza]
MAAADVEFRCFVGGLAWATTEHSLEQAFSQYGQVVDSKIINDRETGRSRGFGFVTFRDEQSMRDAIDAMNGQDLDGRSITVNEAQSRGGGGGGGGGGFRGPRREGSGGYGGGNGGGYGGGNGGGYGRREGGNGGGYGRREGGSGGYGGRSGGYGGGGDRSYSRSGGSDGNWRE